MGEWIRIEDALPQDYETVLIGSKNDRTINIGYYVGENRVQKSGFWTEKFETSNIENVTHWMYIPPLFEGK
ncbi:MAG: DUF551 domain-containing protein [Simkania sp.]|nr:DUF551 domain-containing protein [Simkania sp.]